MEGFFTPLLKDPANLPASLVSTTAVLLVIPLILLLLLRRASASSKRIKLPPGPRGLPLIGHLHLLGHNFHRFLSTLSSTHGPLVFLRCGCVPVVVASTPTMAQQILQAHDQTFSSRSQHAAPMQLNNCESMVFSQPGPYWKLMRQLFSTNLFAPRRFASFLPLITEEVHGLLRSILKKANQVPLRAELVAATGNIVWRMAVGKKLADVAPSNLPTVLAEYHHMLAAFNVGDFVPCLAWMDLQGCVRESRAIAQKLHKIWQEVIDGRRESRCQSDKLKPNAEEQDNFLDVLIAASDRRSDVPVTDSNIMAILTEIFTAGIDTSSVSTEWAFSDLLTNPIKLKKSQDELDRVVGTSRLVQVSDIPQLPYLQAVVKESMRLHPVAPFLVPHKASQACTIAGYDIPAGTVAYVNVWAIGRDPEIWERPLEFSPERFLDRDTDVRGQHFELLPFGSGRRACPGMILGLLNVQYMLASMVHCFDWSLVAEPNMSEKFSLAMTLEKPLLAKATPRLPMHLFEI